MTLALLTLLCTCARAQINVNRLPKEVSSVAFIKGNTGFLIDSLTIRTSLDTVPYGFAFTQDTLLLDISIFRPVDELTLETFAGGHSFGRHRCWVDAPSADVYLSVASGKGIVDSVGLSPMNRWYRDEITKIQSAPNLEVAKSLIANATYDCIDLLIAADFLEVYYSLPNLSRQDIGFLTSVLQVEMETVKKHPRFVPLLAKRRLMVSNPQRKLKRYGFMNDAGVVGEITTPDTDYWVLNLYTSTNEASRADHALIRQVMAKDTLFDDVPIVSISADKDTEAWQAYLKEGRFTWPHYREIATTSAGLTERVGIYPGRTYLLLDEKNRIEGVYDDLAKLAAALIWRRDASKP